MIIKNRKLIRRDDLGPIADYIDLDRLKADAEAAMLEIDDNAWYNNTWYDDANKHTLVADLFDWYNKPQSHRFWQVVTACFTVEPLPPDTIRLAEIDGEIARLKAEREQLAKDEESK